ncbi:uncharacterized protein DUF1707 [Rhodococcus sp. SMB37]|uniref:DUF1707 SHOCT-like domain-containing protein n=1 Tax=Rhodococcus sp. SMB37 TaxID=2512213 RepID=UPI0010F23091|nr:DUF1707 domain-containing protein [Rhodococcus sp. SMB37]TCN45888.1 uncharacterized protein DUF1707 [Rhodococcus sp. SMB37]
MSRRQSPPTRARDSDRARTRTRLDLAYAEGQVTTEEWRDLVARAENAKTLPELADLVRDLQPPAEPEDDRSGKASGRWIAPVVAGVAIVAVGAVVWGALPDRGTPPPGEPVAVAPAVAPDPVDEDDGGEDDGGVEPIVVDVVDPLEPGGLARVVDDYRAAFGDTVVHTFGVYPDFATVERAESESSNRVVGYTYRGGFQRSGSPPSNRMSTYSDLDLSTIDVAAFSDLVARAPELLGRPGGSVTHVLVRNDGMVTMNVYVDDDTRGSGYVKATAAGEILRTYE